MPQFNTMNDIFVLKSGQFKYAAYLNTEFSSPHDGTSSSSDYIVSVGDCLYDAFSATLQIRNPFLPSATWKCAMLRWQGSQLIWITRKKFWPIGKDFGLYSEGASFKSPRGKRWRWEVSWFFLNSQKKSRDTSSAP